MARERRTALGLAIFTVGYNVLEGVVAITAAVWAGSTALLGFGLDSFVESLSGGVMVWRFWRYGIDREDPAVAAVERRAARLVALSLLILGLYIAWDAGAALYFAQSPDPSLLGIAIATASVVIMPVLFIAKYRLGRRIGSGSLVADSKETLACVMLSVALLVGLGLNYVWNLWWADPVAALVIAALVIREAVETFLESGDDSNSTDVPRK